MKKRPLSRTPIVKTRLLSRILTLVKLFIKEQIKAPSSAVLIILPCALFYLPITTKQDVNPLENDYITASSWLYAYLSSSTALFGFAAYIIERRETGFIRSLIHSKKSIAVFLYSHFLANSVTSVAYCAIFYLTTKLPFGAYELKEILTIIVRFYICFTMFCSIGAALTLLPINFKNSNTLLIILSFFMLIFGVVGTNNPHSVMDAINSANPLAIAGQLMARDITLSQATVVLIVITSILSAFILLRHLRINPTWSRY